MRGREGGGRGSNRDGWSLPEPNSLPAAVPRPSAAPPLQASQTASRPEASSSRACPSLRVLPYPSPTPTFSSGAPYPALHQVQWVGSPSVGLPTW